ncbi:MAG TPA: response regulator [Verrucomicrobiae bacterium]|nr:response regulator [Verrucomicrobiae bacterium]
MICSPTTVVPESVLCQVAPEALPTALEAVSRPRRKVLIADDSLVWVTALSMKLRNHGYDVVVCQQGARIVSAARSEKPDLILLDINFPPDVANGGEAPWDGLTVLEWLRGLDETRNTPVIIVTAEEPARCREKSFAAGADGFFEKPVRPGTLLTAIRLALEEEPTEADE